MDSKYTIEQIKKFLEGYVEVSPVDWATIPLMTHVRYFKKNKKFVRGGFVASHWTRDGKRFTHLANNINKNAPNYIAWPMAHENIFKVFRKTDKTVNTINKLVSVVKQQQQKIEKQDAVIKQIIRKVNS